MTVNDIFNDFRIQMNDLVTPNRYRDALLLVWYNDGLREIYARRPDAYEDVIFENDTVTEATTTADAFIFVEQLKRGMILHLLRRAAEHDGDFKKAGYFMQEFINEVKG